MADSTISALSAAAALLGTEAVPLVQGNSTLRTTTREIADLAASAIDVVSNALSAHVANYLSLVDRVSANSGTGGAGSVTSNEVSVGDAALSARIDTASNVGSLNTVSINALSNRLSAVTVRTSVGGATSIKGLQSALDSLSTQISNEASIRAASIQTASAAATSIGVCVNAISNQLSAVTTRTSVGGATSTKGLQSALNNLSTQVSNEASIRAASVNTASAAATSIGICVNAISNQLSGVTVRTSSGGGTSIKGLQSALNTLSTQISNEGSVRAASVQTASAAATSVLACVNTISNLLSGLTTRTSVGGATSTKGLQSCLNNLSTQVSNEASIRAASVQTASAAATSVDTRVNSVLSNEISVLESVVSVQISQLISAVSNVSATSAGGGSATGLQAVIDALSNKISTVVAGAASVTSNELSALSSKLSSYSVRGFSASGSATASVKGIQSCLDRISNTFSGSFSAGSVQRGRTRVLTATVKGSVPTALADITGTTVAISAGFYYEYQARLNVTISVANTYGIGITFPAMSANCAGGYMIGFGSMGASAWQSTVGNVRIIGFDEDSSGSIILSVTKGATSLTPVEVKANWVPTANGNVVLQYRASVSTSNVKIMPGSYVKCVRLVDTGQ